MAHAALLHCSLLTACRRGSHHHRAPSHVPRRSRPRRRGGVVSLRPMASSTAQAPAPAPPGLKEGIAGLYDESSGLWESIWGDHMHHGFYDSGEAASMADHRRAQIRMIEEALAFAAVPSPGASTPACPGRTLVFVSTGIVQVYRFLIG